MGIERTQHAIDGAVDEILSFNVFDIIFLSLWKGYW